MLIRTWWVVAVGLLCATPALAQSQPLPEPKLPPMPSMEGPEPTGDMAKPVMSKPATLKAAGPADKAAPTDVKTTAKKGAKTEAAKTKPQRARRGSHARQTGRHATPARHGVKGHPQVKHSAPKHTGHAAASGHKKHRR